MNFAPNWIDMPDAQLAEIAKQAFLMGLRDGKVLSNPVSRYRVIAELTHINGANGALRIFHISKMRQVYGAGFDIARKSHAKNL